MGSTSLPSVWDSTSCSTRFALNQDLVGLPIMYNLYQDDTGPLSANTADITEGASEAEEETLQTFFNNPFLTFVKTCTMFVGELEFSDIPINLDSKLMPLSYLYFLSFVILIVVVLMNLLNGLAVSDIRMIQERAETVAYLSIVDTVRLNKQVSEEST